MGEGTNPSPTINERRITMNDLFETLKQLTINNARTIAESIQDNGDDDGIYEDLIQAIDRCDNGVGTDEDWSFLVEQTEM